jgi:tetratricopeptide (TPR) repeat protein
LVPGEFCAVVARVNLRDKKYGETLDWVRKGLRWEKRNPDLYFYGGEAAREMAVGGMGDRDIYLRDSLIAFSAGFEVFPYDSRMAVKLAQAQANLGGFLDASNTIATAEELDPNSSFVKAYRGIVELTGGYLDDAENAFQEAIELGGEGSSVARKGLDAVKETREKLEGAQPESPAVREMLEKLAATIEAESGGEESGGATPGAAEPGTTPATPDAPPPSPESPGAPSPPGATAP